MATVDVGTGTTLTFGTSAFSAEVTGVDWTGFNFESVETTHMGTGTARTFMRSDLYDPGEVTIDYNYDPSKTPPITTTSETVTITLPDTTTWAGTGFMTSYEWNDPLEDRMSATLTIKLTGAITIT